MRSKRAQRATWHSDRAQATLWEIEHIKSETDRQVGTEGWSLSIGQKETVENTSLI